jgi:hypothetical protein
MRRIWSCSDRSRRIIAGGYNHTRQTEKAHPWALQRLTEAYGKIVEEV